MLTTLKGVEVKYVIRLRFNVTNNEAEYEALVTGLSAAKEVGVESVAIYTISKLVEGQVTGE